MRNGSRARRLKRRSPRERARTLLFSILSCILNYIDHEAARAREDCNGTSRTIDMYREGERENTFSSTSASGRTISRRGGDYYQIRSSLIRSIVVVGLHGCVSGWCTRRGTSTWRRNSKRGTRKPPRIFSFVGRAPPVRRCVK